MEGDQEVAKRSGRNEPMWVAVQKWMEATLAISLYSYLYPKLAKCFSYYLLSFLFKKIREKGGTDTAWKWE
jgi:endo-1,4-beta-D-glucanase Y